MGQIGCTETSVTNYKHRLHSTPEQRRCHFHCGGCLKSQKSYDVKAVWSARPYHECVNLLKSTGHAMQQQFNIQQLYVLPTLYLWVLYLSENKQPFVTLHHKLVFIEMKSVYCEVRTGSLNKTACASSLKG